MNLTARVSVLVRQRDDDDGGDADLTSCKAD